MESLSKLSEDDLVPPPRATRKVAIAIIFLILLVPVILLTAPWLQNVSSRGRVIAFDPTERLMVLPSPVSGRVVRVLVQEGSRVKKGDVIMELADLDALLATRLEQGVAFAREKLRAAREGATALERQAESTTASRDLALSVARLELDMATQQVRVAEQDLVSARATLAQSIQNRDRREALRKKTLESEFELERAIRDAVAAQASVDRAEARLTQSLAEVEARKAEIDKTQADFQARLDAIASSLESARGRIATEDIAVQSALTSFERQETQTVKAPRDGIVLKINAAAQTELVKQGDKLVEFVPDTKRMAVELFVKGNDAPLISPGRKVRLQFEGWPAVQFVGWPSVAVGTFGGVVKLIDAHGDGRGLFRILVEPDPEDMSWPDQPYLRQGVEAKGWVLLDEVSLGFEIWRQLNGFPPSLQTAPDQKAP